MLDGVLSILERWAEILPLPVFTFIGAFTEEIIAPIPSPFVMTLAGSLAEAQGQPFIFLLFLAFLGALGKTIGSLIIYVIADKFEDVITGKFGKFIGVSHKQVVGLGERLENGRGEWLGIFILRALPIMPTAPVSLAAGVLQLNLRTYLSSTALGLVVRNLFYLYLGYTSTNALAQINNDLDGLETVGYGLVLVCAAGLMFYIYRSRRKQD